jgi:hypothetical protein
LPRFSGGNNLYGVTAPRELPRIWLRIVPMLLLFHYASACRAQPGAFTGSPLTVNAGFGGAFAKLFGEIRWFSADATMDVWVITNAARPTPPRTIRVKFYYLDGFTRMETDLTELPFSKVSPEVAAAMKRYVLDKFVIIERPDRERIWIVVPGAESYVERQFSERVARSQDGLKIHTTDVAKEIFEGHPCVKKRVAVWTEKLARADTTVWYATDMNEFPLKIESARHVLRGRIVFSNVALTRPDAGLFNCPTNFARFENLPALYQAFAAKHRSGDSTAPRSSP